MSGLPIYRRNVKNVEAFHPINKLDRQPRPFYDKRTEKGGGETPTSGSLPVPFLFNVNQPSLFSLPPPPPLLFPEFPVIFETRLVREESASRQTILDNDDASSFRAFRKWKMVKMVRGVLGLERD